MRLHPALEELLLLKEFSPNTKRLFHEFFESAEKDGVIHPQPRTLRSRAERAAIVKAAGYNVFNIEDEDVYVDCLTDSGTSRRSENQWLSMFRAHSSYAGNTSWKKRLAVAIEHIFGFPFIVPGSGVRHILPAHQGRGAEQVFFEVMLAGEQKHILGNEPFDTTRLHMELNRGIVVNGTTERAYQEAYDSFKGNADRQKLAAGFREHRGQVACVLMTATCNSVGGQPVSSENLAMVREMAHVNGVPLVVDFARYAENAFFIQRREPGHQRLSIPEVVLEEAQYADAILVSAKKDAMGHGGFIAVRDPKLAAALCPGVIAREGFLDYGGMSGPEMEAITIGLIESLDEKYLEERIRLHFRFEQYLREVGMPVDQAGGHGVFLRADILFPHIPWYHFPGKVLECALYERGGIRGVEVGSLMLGRSPDTHKLRKARKEMTRLAFPRRVYGEDAISHIAEVCAEIVRDREEFTGMTFADGGEAGGVPHFLSRFEVLHK